MTPLGMTFSELASMTGGGVQTPGFMGHGKHFIASKKFMKAEGGVAAYRMDAEGAEGSGGRETEPDSKRAVRHRQLLLI